MQQAVNLKLLLLSTTRFGCPLVTTRPIGVSEAVHFDSDMDVHTGAVHSMKNG